MPSDSTPSVLPRLAPRGVAVGAPAVRPDSLVRAPAPRRAASSSRRTLIRDHRYRRLLAAADVTACATALATCVALLGSGGRLTLGLLASLPLAVLFSKLLGLYDRDDLVMHKSTLDEAGGLFQLATLFALVVWIAEGPLQVGRLESGQVAALWGTLFLLLVAGRFGARAIARRITPAERCLLLGDPAGCRRVRAKIAASGRINADVVAEIASPRIGEEEVPIEVLAEIASEQEIQRVIIAPRSTDHGDVLNLVRAAKSLGLKVSVLPRLLEIVGSSVVIDDVGGLRVLGVGRFGLSRSSLLVKRGLDVMASAVGLVVLAPLFVLAALAVKADSRGPVFFRQRRIGRDGRSFRMFKFRTMCENADALKEGLRERNETPGLFKLSEDPRVTRVGRVLRRSALDELPQLLNVLSGEMSLVGPRPLIDEDDARIEGWDRHRLHLTPGMTGPWQILGPGRLPLTEMVKLDYLYVASWSLWSDIKILLRTGAFVLRRQGI